MSPCISTSGHRHHWCMYTTWELWPQYVVYSNGLGIFENSQVPMWVWTLETWTHALDTVAAWAIFLEHLNFGKSLFIKIKIIWLATSEHSTEYLCPCPSSALFLSNETNVQIMRVFPRSSSCFIRNNEMFMWESRTGHAAVKNLQCHLQWIWFSRALFKRAQRRRVPWHQWYECWRLTCLTTVQAVIFLGYIQLLLEPWNLAQSQSWMDWEVGLEQGGAS